MRSGVDRRPVRVVAVGGIAALALLAAACTPGSGSQGQATSEQPKSISTNVAKAGDVTLTVWDQEVRGGQDAEISKLNDEFEKKYPNVHIKRNSKSFKNLKDTLKLALSGKHPPDVVEANQGYPDMGAFVRAGLLLPLGKYAKAYGWKSRYAKTLLDLNRFGEDGKTFGAGDLYGISQTGEIVGIFYNKKKMKELGLSKPKTWGEFKSMLGKIKQKGQLPIMFGNKNKYPAIHTFGAVQAQTLGKQGVLDLVFGKDHAKWTSPQNEQAATTLRDWSSKGYMSKGANGLGYDQAATDFEKGNGVFLITGTWLAADLAKAMKKNVGFMLPPPVKAGDPSVTTGGEGLAWSITSKSQHPNVAAAYINFITTAHAADVMTRTGNLPAMTPASARPESGTVLAQIFAAWKKERKSNGLVPYLDYTTPDFYDTLTTQLQQLIGGRTSPRQCVKALQQDYAQFQRSR